MTTSRGVFIAIEGTDGSGKGTQCKHLVARLMREGYDVATFDFPQYDQFSSFFVQQYLNGRYGTAAEVGPYTASLFYALDRYEATPQIRKALEQGKVVVANRFVGSSMAHQGTKFQHAEERRGFFIWLDNLEFEMLRIPRPSLSLVLRVPAETAQQLVDQKEQRSYTDQKRDLHEADLTHLKRSVEVYDDMCQLFPADFARIDCTRDAQLISVNAIHDIIWQKIEPMLPANPNKRSQNAASSDIAVPLPVAGKTAPTTGIHLATKYVSLLASIKLELNRPTLNITPHSEHISYDQKQKNGSYHYYVPDYFDTKLQEQYRAYTDQIFNLYSEIVRGLTEYFDKTQPTKADGNNSQEEQRLQAIRIAEAVLPLSTLTAVGIHDSAPAIENAITRLLSDSLPEAYETGKQLLSEARKSQPTFMDTADLAGGVTYRTTVAKHIAAIAREHLPAQHADGNDVVTLTDVWPHNECDLIPDMLYEQSSLSLKELRQQTAGWPYRLKAGVLDAYIGKRTHRGQRPGKALEKARYSWDLLCEFSVFNDLQRYCKADSLAWQELTPRYGYDVPKSIEDAGLLDQFEACFELSLRLHGILQTAGYGPEAQYATLRGHTMRWKLTYNAREAYYLHERYAADHDSPAVRKLIAEMHIKLAEKHPILAESMRFTNSA